MLSKTARYTKNAAIAILADYHGGTPLREARNSKVHNLTIAKRRIEKLAQSQPPVRRSQYLGAARIWSDVVKRISRAGVRELRALAEQAN